MITTELKDNVLHYLITNEEDLCVDMVDADKLATELNSKGAYVESILHDLKSRGMLDLYGMAGRIYTCHLTVKIFDFKNNGGYKMEDEIINDQLKKLSLEIQSLSEELAKNKFDKVMTTIGTIMSVWTGAFK
jgi:hemerythrin superfamily protein